MTTLLDRFEESVRADPSRPMLTWYRPADGARIELSGATAATWVAKLAGLLRDGCDLAPGDGVAVELDGHWLGLLLPLAVWRAEGALASGAAADLLVRPADSAEPMPGRTVIAAPRGALAMPEPVADGVVDLAREARVHPDHYSGPRPGSDALALLEPPTSHGYLLTAASEADYQPTDRVLVVGTDTDRLRQRWLAAIAGGASLVAIDGDDAAVAAAESVTAIG